MPPPTPFVSPADLDALRRRGRHALDSGAVYIFEHDETRTAGWRMVQKVEASDRAAGDRFGHAVAISGDSIVVGAQGHDDRSGAVYVLIRGAGTGVKWREAQKLQAPDAQAGARFGWSVAACAHGAGAGLFEGWVWQVPAYSPGESTEWRAAPNMGLSRQIASQVAKTKLGLGNLGLGRANRSNKQSVFPT